MSNSSINNLWEAYKKLGGTNETLSLGMQRIAGDLSSDLTKLEYWKEWRNIVDGHPPTQIRGLELMKILGVKTL